MKRRKTKDEGERVSKGKNEDVKEGEKEKMRERDAVCGKGRRRGNCVSLRGWV